MYNKVITSGIFKLENGKPVDLYKWVPNKKCFSDKNGIGLENTLSLASEVSYEIERFQDDGVDIDELSNRLASAYEISIIACLKCCGFNEKELEPHYSRMIEKMKKVLKKRISEDYYQGLTGPKKNDFKKIMWIDRIVKIFQAYTDLDNASIDRYVVHLLFSLGIEKGSKKTINSRIKKRRSLYKETIESINKQMEALTRGLKPAN